MIALYHAPSNTSGSLRLVKLTKYLAKYGWDTSVLTVPLNRYRTIDDALLQELPPSIRIHRARCWDARSFGVRGKYPAAVAVPDRYVSWLPDGVRTALRALREESIDAVLSSSPVATAHLIARAVAAVTRKPWIAEFRDPWPHHVDTMRPWRSIERYLEAQVLRHADRVLASTPELLATLDSVNPQVRAKGRVLYNGFDEDDMQRVEAVGEREDFVLTHAGLLSRDYRDPSALLVALHHSIRSGVLPPTTCLNLLGGAGGDTTPIIRDLCHSLNLADRVRVDGRVPHLQAVAAMREASVLVLLQGGLVARQLPAKTFEYLRSGRPVLALTPTEGATARFLRGFAGVYRADPDDSGAIEQRLAEIVADRRAGLRMFDRREGLRRFTREATARELMTILAEVSDDGERRGALMHKRPENSVRVGAATHGEQRGDPAPTLDERRAHYEIETALAARLRAATPEERRRLYPRLYDELLRQLPSHPRWRRALDPERRHAAAALKLRRLRPWLSKDKTFVDIGCGDGILAASVAPAVRRAYAIDASARLRIHDDPAHCSFIVADAMHLPIPAARVDVAYSNQFVEHLHPEDMLLHLREVFRVLADGGVYVCFTPNRLHGPHDVSRGFDAQATGMHLREYTASELSHLFRCAGFSRVKVHITFKGARLVMPPRSVAPIEALLQSLPRRLQTVIVNALPFRLLAVVQVSGHKPAKHVEAAGKQSGSNQIALPALTRRRR